MWEIENCTNVSRALRSGYRQLPRVHPTLLFDGETSVQPTVSQTVDRLYRSEEIFISMKAIRSFTGLRFGR